MGRSLDPKSIKSAQRVFEVLEYFDEEHPEASVTDISRRYGYPQSSASELLSYMVHLGYLRRSARGRKFQLSMRVAMLGTWVQPQLVRNGKLLRLMDDLADDVGASVVLASSVGVRVQCVHVVRRHSFAPRQGEFLDLLSSAEGHALLLTTDRSLVRKYVHRINSEMAPDVDRIRFEDLAVELDGASLRGYVRRQGENGAQYSILIPNADRHEQLSLSVHAPSGAREEDVVRAMRSIVSRTLGLVSVGSAMPPHVTHARQLVKYAR
jgi:DNA-binding IclR family transcriptional regulator